MSDNQVIEVTLTWEEVYEASQVGITRTIESRKQGLKSIRTKGLEVWGIDIGGAIGEFAAAKALGIEWSKSVNTFRTGGDVGPYQIRCATNHNYRLKFSDRDKDAVYILVTGNVLLGGSLTYKLQGWLRPHEGRKPEFFFDPNGRGSAYWVDQKFLHPMSTLPSIEEAQALSDVYDNSVK